MLVNVGFLSHGGQAHPPEGHGAGPAVLRGVRRVQLLCAGAAGKHLCPEEGGQAGPHRRFRHARQLAAGRSGSRAKRGMAATVAARFDYPQRGAALSA